LKQYFILLTFYSFSRLAMANCEDKSSPGELCSTAKSPNIFASNDSDTQTLSWDSDDDPKNPYNWPVSQKWILTCLASFATFLTMMNGTMATVAHLEISEIFNVSETSFPHSYWIVTTWATGGVFSALFILPLAEDFGTRPVFLSTT
jgi:hypothetical protein